MSFFTTKAAVPPPPAPLPLPAAGIMPDLESLIDQSIPLAPEVQPSPLATPVAVAPSLAPAAPPVALAPAPAAAIAPAPVAPVAPAPIAMPAVQAAALAPLPIEPAPVAASQAPLPEASLPVAPVAPPVASLPEPVIITPRPTPQIVFSTPLGSAPNAADTHVNPLTKIAEQIRQNLAKGSASEREALTDDVKAMDSELQALELEEAELHQLLSNLDLLKLTLKARRGGLAERIHSLEVMDQSVLEELKDL